MTGFVLTGLIGTATLGKDALMPGFMNYNYVGLKVISVPKPLLNSSKPVFIEIVAKNLDVLRHSQLLFGYSTISHTSLVSASRKAVSVYADDKNFYLKHEGTYLTVTANVDYTLIDSVPADAVLMT